MVRRLISVAIAGCALIVASGCSTASETPNAADSPAAAAQISPAPSTAPAIVLVDKETTCAAYNKMMEDLAGKVLEIGGRLNQAGNDSAAFAAAVSDMQKNWTAAQTQLELQAAAAADPAVKAAITEFATEAKKAVAAATAAGGDVNKTRNALNSPTLLQAQLKATEICG